MNETFFIRTIWQPNGNAPQTGRAAYVQISTIKQQNCDTCQPIETNASTATRPFQCCSVCSGGDLLRKFSTVNQISSFLSLERESQLAAPAAGPKHSH